ncbi:hypothetical protein MNB_SM-7-747 [hydrothermal vent metagenome]|uniref:PIN domain-containing protein n=1 Tax=hydrothermal vent metagenome TaxID=652676 RepID=A0A1W1C3F8_9ZZZZ
MKIMLDANVCLDLLDTKRPTSQKSVKWYLSCKDNEEDLFYFSADFIMTFYYILTEKRKHDPKMTLNTIDALSEEIAPLYLTHGDYIHAKELFLDDFFEDFEDLLLLCSASRAGITHLITNDKKLLQLERFESIKIVAP